MPDKLVNMGTHPARSLSECQPKGSPEDIRRDPPQPYCDPTTNPPEDWVADQSVKKTGLGRANLCDPMQTGQIVNEAGAGAGVVYRYSKAIRSCDEAMLDMFKNMIVLDEDGKAHPVPAIWATQEGAVAAILQDNVRKDDSLVVDRIRLPMMSIYSNSFQFNQDRYIYHQAIDYIRNRPDGKPGFTASEKFDRDTVFGRARGIPVDVGYTLYCWTTYMEDMNQIMEQIILKFSPIAYIRVRGVPWEVGVKLDSIANNLQPEPGDKANRVIKFEFGMTAETFIPQPLVRRKAVLRTRVNIFDGVEPERITQIIDRLEDAVDGGR